MRSADPQLAGLGEQARRLQPRTVALRRALHRHPELGLNLPRTRDAVVAELANLPVQVHHGRATTSVVAVLEGARGELIDGRPYADPLFVAELERYHQLAVEAHREHTPLSAPLPPLPGAVYAEVVDNPESRSGTAAWALSPPASSPPAAGPQEAL